jgi:hypothetical protein
MRSWHRSGSCSARPDRAPWGLHLVCLAPSVAMPGVPLPEALFPGAPPPGAAAPEALRRPSRGIAVFFTAMLLLPPVPGLPTLRQFQADQGAVARAWLGRLAGFLTELSASFRQPWSLPRRRLRRQAPRRLLENRPSTVARQLAGYDPPSRGHIMTTNEIVGAIDIVVLLVAIASGIARAASICAAPRSHCRWPARLKRIRSNGCSADRTFGEYRSKYRTVSSLVPNCNA